ncbi:type-F conjugative transfer system mating-pair stabilization protein TraN [Legionella pneumophila]|uniref:type-F conjugative transfer system mating-pair stabilization protein TraN n=1 Tax=Legionella pneumophila TaxID=446 RepID=UPI00077085B5|nr:type-F conjugative transfer system mating-pair stabilization protein TraN [Legionella pneumophila]CZP45055.1 conjugal transfer mating pair stabilization protein TraN [Legionella pneumophila]
MRGFIGFLCFLLSCCSHANELSSSYKEGEQFASIHQKQSVDLLKSLNLADIPGYQPNLPQEQYYGGVTQKHTQIETDAQSAMQSNEMGKNVADGFNERPFYRINPNSESMQKLNQIAESGDEIIHGRNTEKTTCSLKPQQCHYTWQEKTCLSTKEIGVLRCAKHLRLDVVPYKTETYSLYLRHNRFNRSPYKIVMDLNQPDSCKQGNANCYTLYQGSQIASPIVFPEQCVAVKISIKDNKGLVVIEKNVSCTDKTLSLKVGQCRFGRCNIPYTYTVSMTVESNQSQEYWDNQCQHLEQKTKAGFCYVNEPLHCVEPNQTRVINEVPFTRSCWKERASYRCGGQGENTCDSLQLDRCEQSVSVCIKETEGGCLTYQQTYQCPLNQCTDNELICGQDAFCLEGDCSTHIYNPSDENEFKKAMSSLSAVADASKTFDGNANFIFKGKKMECSDLMLHFANCCREDGWGIDLNLAHCSDEEKKLGKDRENKLVVPTGRYCYKRKKFPGGSYCKEYHQTFCVFQSKLARIVQEQGRRNQLHIGFGEGQHSNCSGITPEQMQLIRFEAIDFSEIYEEIKGKIKEPDYQQTAKSIGTRLNDFYNQGDING